MVRHQGHNAAQGKKDRKKIIEKEIEVAQRLAFIGKKVELVDDGRFSSNDKMYDAHVDGVPWELKKVEKNINRISEHINKGKKQNGGRVAVLINKNIGLSERDIEFATRATIHNDKSNSIKEFFVLYDKNKVYYKKTEY